MRWSPGGESQDIEDRRDEGGGGGFQFGGFHIGIGGAILLFVLSFIFRTNLFALLGGGTVDPGAGVSQPDPSRDAAEKPLVQFVSFVLDDAQNTWTELLPQQTGTPYRHAKLVLFRDYTSPDVAAQQSSTGPFYCPEDERVYIDLGFFDELSQPIRRSRPICAGLCSGARVGASRTEIDRNRRKGASTSGKQFARSEPALGEDWNFKPIVLPESGRIPLNSAACSKRATWNRRSARPPPSVMTVCKKCPPVMSVPNLSPMDLPSSACTGSTLDWKAARFRPATPSHSRIPAHRSVSGSGISVIPRLCGSAFLPVPQLRIQALFQLSIQLEPALASRLACAAKIALLS